MRAILHEKDHCMGFSGRLQLSLQQLRMSGNQIQSTVPRPVYGKYMRQHRNKISQRVNNESGLHSNNKLLAKSRHAVLPVKQTFPITHMASCMDQLAWNHIFNNIAICRFFSIHHNFKLSLHSSLLNCNQIYF